MATRAYQYEHHYGLTLWGKAIKNLRPAKRRSKFLEMFHNLLHEAAKFFKESDDTTVIPDGFPVLNSLKEVHLLLAQGAHNEYGDLPSTARAEMLIQEWLLARPEMRDFLGGRVMVPYTESVDGSCRFDEDAAGLGAMSRSRTSATSECMASRSCCPCDTAIGSRSTISCRQAIGARFSQVQEIPKLRPCLPCSNRC